MTSQERDIRLSHNDDEQVEASSHQTIQQPLGEFMALHMGSGALELENKSATPLAARDQDNNNIHCQTANAMSTGEDEFIQKNTKVENNDKDAEGINENNKKHKKRVRYLHDTDRHNIIKRIDKGEKQAALAREYGVTRAAICHIKKNREEIITRYDLLIKQTQEIDRAENLTASGAGDNLMVREIQSSSVMMLMTTLRDRRSTPATFRRAAGRLIMVLLEEVLAMINANAIEMTTATGYLTYGLERTDKFCGVAIGAEGFPFLVLFHQMEPDAPQGSIQIEQETDEQGHRTWTIDHMDLPSDITKFRILLFSSTVNTGRSECKAIEALRNLGVQEDRITLLFILCSTDSLETICNQFPEVRIITSAIDSRVDPQTQAIIPGLGDFVTRYNGD